MNESAYYPWQKRFISKTFAQDADAALSIARGAGKTTLMACYRLRFC